MGRTAAYARACRKQPHRKDAGEEKVKRRRAQADALALRADERRDKLRKASGRSTYH